MHIARADPNDHPGHNYHGSAQYYCYYCHTSGEHSAAAVDHTCQNTWKDKLTGNITEYYTYPVTDQSMRYAEELARLRFYTLSQRESEIDDFESDVAGVLRALQVQQPVLYESLRRIMGRFINRAFYGLADDYAAAAEMLCHLVTVRRQGYLGAMPHEEDVYRRVLSAPVTTQARILP